jgi:hypothetical protein
MTGYDSRSKYNDENEWPEQFSAPGVVKATTGNPGRVGVGGRGQGIADQLQISTSPLEGRWRAIHRKLGSLNRYQAGFLFAALRKTPPGNARA